jgi:pimeloyl-ACP methyl ester carboxylesterase
MRFHYLDWGNSAAPTILFLHGGALTAHTWDLVCLGLRDRFHCLALDARGHGDSDWAADLDYSVTARIADVEGFVDALGLKDFVLVGMSMGGATAIAYAGRHADQLRALVIVDIGPKGGRPGTGRIRDFVAGPGELDTIEDFVERALAFNPARDRRLLRRSLLHNLRQQPNGRWAWKYDRGRIGKMGPEVAEERERLVAGAVPRITSPTLILRGDRSDVFWDEDAEAFANALPNGRWTRVENAGHTIQGDNPRGFLEAVNPFLAEVVWR